MTKTIKKIYNKFKETEMTKMLDKLNVFFYGCGLKNFWVTEMNLPKNFVKIYDKVTILATIMITGMMFSNFASMFTQKNLSPQQSTDLTLLCATTPIILFDYYNFTYYKEEVRNILYHLIVVLKQYYYDIETEQQLIKKMKMYMGIFVSGWLFTILERLANNLLNMILYAIRYPILFVFFIYSYYLGAVFSPLVTAWPDVNETCSGALAVRLIYYAAAWFYGFRANGTYGLILLLLLTLSYQFKDLQNYFYSLGLIFEDNGLSQEEKENKYEEGFKRGIYLHVLSLWCVRRCQFVCRAIYSSQLLFSTITLILLLRPLLISEELSEKLSQIPIFCAVLTVLALIMWNSGNITYEANLASHAMYASGWHNCQGMSSKRVRKLVVNAMLQAQRPVVLKGFGIIDLSYENWIKIVKTSYSVFSVFY